MRIAINDRYDWRHMYKRFIETANEDYNLTESKINHYTSLLNKIKYKIEENREVIQSMFGICLYNFWEWNTDEPDNNHKLENIIDKVYKMFAPAKQIKFAELYSIFKRYFILISKLQTAKNMLVRISNRKKITLTKYREYLYRYFAQVGREVLQGKIYKFNNRVGCLLIEKVKITPRYDKAGNIISSKRTIDYNLTKLNKARIIKEGKRLYNPEEEKECIRKGIPYDGVKFLVFKDGDSYVRLVMVDGGFKNRALFKFIPCNNRMKTTYDEIMKSITSIKDIIERDDLDIATRVALIKKFDESYTIKYIRNDECRSMYNRSYGCKIGQ